MNQKSIMPAQAVASNIQLSYLSNGTWKAFNDQAQNAMDGIKIQTSSSSSYYFNIGH